MKKLLNTLYINSPDKYLSLEGETVVISENKTECARCPLHNIESIVTMGYAGVSPALLGKCAESGIVVYFLSRSGRFIASSSGPYNGNVVLRKNQYRIFDDENKCTEISKNIITGKIYNSRWVIERATRDYTDSLDIDKLKNISLLLKTSINLISNCKNTEELRGVEGEAASRYFSVFNDLILQQKPDFTFNGRNKRPPVDNVNAMLSFSYTLLNSMVTSALYCVGLDPYVGFMHKDRPGRTSLALDLIEELRSVFADRFVLTLINKRIINKKDFFTKENNAVFFTDEGKKKFLQSWQSKKQTTIVHPYLKEKVQWGMVPYVQALLLARFLRGDIDGYPPFLWKQVIIILVLITYDVSTETPQGRKRLRKVAKQCENYGQRVQNSVFECIMDAAKCREVKEMLINIINEDEDSIRFYFLGNNYKTKVEHYGVKLGFDMEGTLIFQCERDVYI